MSMAKWDPFKNMATLQDRINRLFDDAFPRTATNREALSPSDWHPPVDIYKVDQGIAIRMDLPGVNKEDVSVEVKDSLLTIKGERKIDEAINDDSFYRRERAFGNFLRSFAMQTSIVPENIKATFKKGVLKIEVSKPMNVQAKQVSVKIE